MKVQRALLPLLVTAAVTAVATSYASTLSTRNSEGGPAPESTLSSQDKTNVPYDGRFTFVRLRFNSSRGGFGDFGGSQAPWAHDYPRAERNLMRLVGEISSLSPYLGGSNILATDDPELFKYPVAYMSEPGFWTPSDKEAAGLRNYLLKGGFIIFDDFRGGDIYNFQTQIQRVLPGAELVELDVSHPVFHAFFDMESLEFSAPTFRRFQPVYYGIFENNDQNRRLMAVANYNNDIGDYWEYSDTGWLPVDLSNAAYKLGINYIVYSLTH